MNTKKNIEIIFSNKDSWDIEQPILGHKVRFQEKIKNQYPKKKKKWFYKSIAASIILTIGTLYTVSIINQKSGNIELSKENQQTEDYFSSLINSELSNLQNKQTPQNKKLIEDAMIQLSSLEKDYTILKLEVAKHGENKQILYAMLTNMQTRISFIKIVLDQVEIIDQLKNNQNEKFI